MLLRCATQRPRLHLQTPAPCSFCKRKIPFGIGTFARSRPQTPPHQPGPSACTSGRCVGNKHDHAPATKVCNVRANDTQAHVNSRKGVNDEANQHGVCFGGTSATVLLPSRHRDIFCIDAQSQLFQMCNIRLVLDKQDPLEGIREDLDVSTATRTKITTNLAPPCFKLDTISCSSAIGFPALGVDLLGDQAILILRR